MASPHKIVKLGMEDVVREQLVDGRTHAQVVEAVNLELVVRHDDKPGKPPSISIAALERYLASLPDGAVPALHDARVAKANADLALDFAGRFKKRMNTLDEWLTAVDEAHRYITVNGEQVDLGPDWQARKAMMSEERRMLQLYVDLMERLYNAEQVQQFQDTVMGIIRAADPEIAKKIDRELQSRRETRAAALLGIGP